MINIFDEKVNPEKDKIVFLRPTKCILFKALMQQQMTVTYLGTYPNHKKQAIMHI